MATSTTAHPIRTLREHVTALEAAITLCLADPTPKPVHRLRTSTRRIEAQLTLLELLPALPLHDKPTRKARGLLKKLRRAAGQVRDIDVQIDLIAAETPDDAPKSIQKKSLQLRETLNHQRTAAAQRLIQILQKHQAKLALTLESLLTTLAPAEPLTIAPTQLTTLIHSWFTQNTPAEPASRDDDPEHLHAIRKTAKLARYLAENAPKSAHTPRKLARAFESVQQAGGDWHDWLILSTIARNELGKSSPLTESFANKCHSALAIYYRRLEALPAAPMHH
jgi:CHAD domain-containing protein